MKTTKKEFERFQKAFLYYVNLLGLRDYSIVFRHIECDGAYATIIRCEDAKMFIVDFNTQRDKGDPKTPEDSARHEAVHGLLSKLVIIAKRRFVTEIELEQAEEGIVRVLEKCIPLPP